MSFRVAILGCGTVGGGVARILREQREALRERAGRDIELTRIVDLYPERSSTRHGVPRELYAGGTAELSAAEAAVEVRKVLEDPGIDLVVETIGGSGRDILGIALEALEHGKHLVTANKALLAKHGDEILARARERGRGLGFEAAVCGAIPIIKGLNECFTGDELVSISGIMNGTSNYILSKMDAEGASFEAALRDAQARGYAEADPTLDIDGGDAGHKLTILLRLAFGLHIDFEDLPRQGIDTITAGDVAFAHEMGGVIKLICYAQRQGGGVHAAVRPMIVKRSNLLSKIDGATNAVRLVGRYAGENVLIGQGAGSLETGSSIVADIVFLARYGDCALPRPSARALELRPLEEIEMPYNLVFETADVPGITGIVTTAVGAQQINIDTVSHNRHENKHAEFAIATMPCRGVQVERALRDIAENHPGTLLAPPRVLPILA
ncbi:MAG TPA: homoserine dehydrogenase [Longimicrobiales bacterium]|nr:homoserine dehydrogenase [Longimicrobiales bacterium]